MGAQAAIEAAQVDFAVMKSRARARAYLAHAESFPYTKECWGEAMSNATTVCKTGTKLALKTNRTLVKCRPVCEPVCKAVDEIQQVKVAGGFDSSSSTCVASQC